MPGKKKGKKGKKKGKRSKSSDRGEKTEPMAPDRVQPPPLVGEKLMKLLMTHKVEEKELHGFKISTRALDQLTPQEIRDLRVVFEVFDMNSDGFIGHIELRKAMKALGFKVSREVAKQMITDASVKAQGSIDFNEFLDLVIEQQGDARDIYDEIMQGFDMFDYDKTGQLALRNLKEACKDAGVKFTAKELEEMMEEADLNGDGVVDKDEFIKIMLQTNLF